MNKNGTVIEEGADVQLDIAELLYEIKNDLSFAYIKARKYLDIMVRLALEHDNELDEDMMPTRSKMSLPYKFAQVEESLGGMNEFLWPKMNFIEAIPRGPGITMEMARNVALGLYHMVVDEMNSPEECLPILRDTVKVSLGYGIIEPYTYQELQREIISLEGDGNKLLSRAVRMGVSEQKQSLRIRYVSPGQVIPYPDGYTTNGNGRSSCIFMMDFLSEREFINLVSKIRSDAETLDFNVAELSDETIKKVIERAKRGTFDIIPDGWFDYIKNLGGIDYKQLKSADRTAKATIPILRVYREGEHIWLANGDTIIYRQAARSQTFRCPLIRACAVRDGMNWFPYSSAEAMSEINFNRNIWLNVVFDIMTWVANRPLVYSTSAFDEAPEFGPNAKIPVTSPNARDGAAFLAPPGIDAGTINLGQIMDDKAAMISGDRDFTQKNFSRGGQHAFNDLLNSTQGRRRLAGAVMESGFQKEIFEQVMIYMQIAGIGFEGNTTTFNESTGEEEMSFLTVSEDDFKHSFRINVSGDRKYTADEFSVSERISIYREKKQDPGTDLYELDRFLFGSDDLVHRISKPKDEVNRIQAEDRQDQRMQNQLGINSRQSQNPQSPEIAGAMLGGAPNA